MIVNSLVVRPVILILILILILTLTPQAFDYFFLRRFKRSNIIKAFKLLVYPSSASKETIKNKDKVKVSNSFILFFNYLFTFRLG